MAKLRRRKRKPQRENTVDIIDRYLLTRVVDRNGKASSLTFLEAIMTQLYQKQITGNTRAARTLMKFEGISKNVTEKRAQLEFCDSEYTRSLLKETDDG